MALKLDVDSAFIILSLGGKSFTLTAPEASLTIGAPDTPVPNEPTKKEKRQRIRWKYHASYEDAFDLGPLSQAAEIITEIGSILPQAASGVTTADELEAKWNAVTDGLKQLPVLANAEENVRATILGTSAKITDIALELDLTTITTTPAGSTGTSVTRGGGAFTLGLAFTPDPDHPIRLFALGITAFGAVISVRLDGLIVRDSSLAFE
jgi:hypothetical protein